MKRGLHISLQTFVATLIAVVALQGCKPAVKAPSYDPKDHIPDADRYLPHSSSSSDNSSSDSSNSSASEITTANSSESSSLSSDSSSSESSSSSSTNYVFTSSSSESSSSAVASSAVSSIALSSAVSSVTSSASSSVISSVASSIASSDSSSSSSTNYVFTSSSSDSSSSSAISSAVSSVSSSLTSSAASSFTSSTLSSVASSAISSLASSAASSDSSSSSSTNYVFTSSSSDSSATVSSTSSTTSSISSVSSSSSSTSSVVSSISSSASSISSVSSSAVSSVASSSASSSATPIAALVRYKFDDPIGATHFVDTSGNHFDASCAGNACPAASYPGHCVNSILFDGTTDVLSTNFVMPTTDFSIEFWHNPSALLNPQGKPMRPFGSGDAKTGQHGLDFIAAQNGKAKVIFRKNGTKFDFLCGTDPVVGQWEHVVITVSSVSGAVCYRNGVQMNHKATAKEISTGAIKIKVGASGDGRAKYNGLLDDFAIFNRALTPAEVLNHFQNGTP